MDLMNDLVGGRGCAADGTVSASSNPLSRLAGTIMEGSAGSQMQHGPPAMGARGAQMAAMRAGMARGMDVGRAGMSGMVPFHPGMGPPPGPMMGQMMPRPPPPMWADEFQQRPPPMQNGHGAHFEGAWGAAAEAEQAGVWANEFGGPQAAHERQQWERHHHAMMMQRQGSGRGGWLEEAWAGGNIHKQPSMEQLWAESAHHAPGGMESVWQASQSEANFHADARFAHENRGLEEAWDAPAAETKHNAQDVADFSEAWAATEGALEQAWEEAKRGDGVLPMDKLWEEAGTEGQTLEEVWGRTASQLEAFGQEEKLVGEDVVNAPYAFQDANRYTDESMYPDAFAEGMERFNEGDIREALLCFEAELQRHPDNSEAWRMLGQSHAENDQDRLAIDCLERAVDCDPYNLEALMALGVSYVNELDSMRALKNLKAWVQHNPKYAGLEIKVDEYSDGTLMDEVMQLMHAAEQWDPNDADAKVVLGVLYNVSRDYDAAVPVLKAALRIQPHDHSLWNKLGATLANSNRSEEALPAYEEALQRKPKYARAWLNLGISQANLNRYEQAASCYLRALSLNPGAKHIWAYLRIIFTCMERFDLVQKAAAEDVASFGNEFPASVPNSGRQFDSVW